MAAQEDLDTIILLPDKRLYAAVCYNTREGCLGYAFFTIHRAINSAFLDVVGVGNFKTDPSSLGKSLQEEEIQSFLRQGYKVDFVDSNGFTDSRNGFFYQGFHDLDKEFFISGYEEGLGYLKSLWRVGRELLGI